MTTWIAATMIQVGTPTSCEQGSRREKGVWICWEDLWWFLMRDFMTMMCSRALCPPKISWFSSIFWGNHWSEGFYRSVVDVREARWRTYHMKRKKLDKACTDVQRCGLAPFKRQLHLQGTRHEETARVRVSDRFDGPLWCFWKTLGISNNFYAMNHRWLKLLWLALFWIAIINHYHEPVSLWI